MHFAERRINYYSTNMIVMHKSQCPPSIKVKNVRAEKTKRQIQSPTGRTQRNTTNEYVMLQLDWRSARET